MKTSAAGVPALRVIARSARFPVRSALVAALTRRAYLDLVGYTGTLPGLRLLCSLHRPDLSLVEVATISEPVLGALCRLRDAFPRIEFVMVYAAAVPRLVRRASAAGITPLAWSTGDPDGVLEVLRSRAHVPARSRPPYPLTDRERAVITHLGGGCTVAQIAALLRISPYTVEDHKRNIYAKLGVGNQSHAVSRAITLGLFDTPPAAIGDGSRSGADFPPNAAIGSSSMDGGAPPEPPGTKADRDPTPASRGTNVDHDPSRAPRDTGGDGGSSRAIVDGRRDVAPAEENATGGLSTVCSPLDDAGPVADETYAQRPGRAGCLALVHGPAGACRDEVARTLIAQGIPFVLAHPAHRAVLDGRVWWSREQVVTVLVDPDGEDWTLSRRLGGPVVAVHSTPQDAAGTLAAILHGAHALVSMADVRRDLCLVLTLASRGYHTLGSAGLRVLLERASAVASRPAPAASELTARERDILVSIADGHTVHQTARSLGVAVKTVENIQTRLFRKLGTRNRSETLVAAYRLGLLDR